MNTQIFLRSVILLFISTNIFAQDALQECRKKQVEPLGAKYLSFSCNEVKRRFYHSFELWQFMTSKTTASVQVGPDIFTRIDTATGGKNLTKTMLGKDILLYQRSGDTTVSEVDSGDLRDEQFEIGRYTPIYLINYFAEKKAAKDIMSSAEHTVYVLPIGKTVVRLFIRNSDYLLEKVTLFNDDELYGLYGDITRSFNYSDYKNTNGLMYPATAAIEKINGKLHDTVLVSSAQIVDNITPILQVPKGYTIKQEEEKQIDVSIEKYSKNINLVHLKHDNFVSTVVEFKDFLVVADAPLTSKNGELIINEAKKIAPGKPIKYFLFSHFHNWYLGGFRPFVHKGATILTRPEDNAYLAELAKAPRTLSPDSLFLQPKPLKTEVINDSMTISDGDFTMKIYHIGKKSEHTADYLTYYFPSEKLAIEGDLVWIKKEGPLAKAGKTQVGYYQAVKDLGLDVTTVLQAWVSNPKDIKYLIPFDELQRSVLLK
jgi:glyoxylase-like metal-dependent hydrolase (beta-lactamase superfamily II)